jgi:hypothetical protein
MQPAIAGDSAISEVMVDPPGRVARLSYLEGRVSLAAEGGEDWADAVLNRPLTSGDRLVLDADGRAELEVGSSTLHLDRGTEFAFLQLDDAVMLTSLTQGAAAIRVRALDVGETIQVETPNAAVLLRGPGEYHVDVDAEAGHTIVKVRSGAAEVRGGASTYRVRANEEGVFSGLDELHAQIAPIAQRTAFEAWAYDRAAREDRSVSSRYVSNEVIGHEDLDDYGDWLHEPSYGYVWRPRYVGHDWAPYRFGQWVWVSPWGWTWLDDARWGFAPFHYGRWAQLQNRWCWVPGPRHVRPVYAPALVGWAGAPRGVFDPFDRGMRWFPLAPREVYVPGYRHTPRHIRRVNQSNTVVDDDSRITRAYAQRARERNYRYRDDRNALTVASQERVTSRGAAPDQRLHVDGRREAVLEHVRRAREQVRTEQARYESRRAAPEERVIERESRTARPSNGQVTRPAGDEPVQPPRTSRPTVVSPSLATQQSVRREAGETSQTRPSLTQVRPSSPQTRPSPAQTQQSAPPARRSPPSNAAPSAATTRHGNAPAQR